MTKETELTSEITDRISLSRNYIMGIAMVMVILFHCKVFPFNWFGYWGVDIFLFLSGFGIYFSLSKSEKLLNFYLKRLVRIMPAAIICGIVFQLTGCNHTNALLALMGLELWYIRTILLFYLISPFLFFCLTRWGIKAVVLMVIVSEAMSYSLDAAFQCGNILTLTLTWSAARLPVYILGMALPYLAEKKHKVLPSWFMAASAVSGAVLLFALRVLQMRYNKGYVMYLFMPTLLLTPAITYVGMRFSEWCRRIPLCALKCLSFTGTLSLEIYLIHEKLIKKGCSVLKVYDVDALLAKALCMCLAFLLAWLLHKLCSAFRKRVLKFIS